MNESTENESLTDIVERDCAVCLQNCHHPTQLPCGHIFCFLCVKGLALQSKKCGLCRAEIPSNYLDNPILLEKLAPQQTDSEIHQWYYEGRNGWWKYDERSNAELESTFDAGLTECTLLLAGALYIIDFQSMTQYRRSNISRKRHVRREAPTFPAKGIAGIKSEVRIQEEQAKLENSDDTNNDDRGGNNENNNDNDLPIQDEATIDDLIARFQILFSE